jgi:hypothetical protein
MEDAVLIAMVDSAAKGRQAVQLTAFDMRHNLT